MAKRRTKDLRSGTTHLVIAIAPEEIEPKKVQPACGLLAIQLPILCTGRFDLPTIRIFFYILSIWKIILLAKIARHCLGCAEQISSPLGNSRCKLWENQGIDISLLRALTGKAIWPHGRPGMLGKDGCRVPIKLSMANLILDGRILGRVGVPRDIADRQLATEQIKISGEDSKSMALSVEVTEVVFGC